MMKTRNAFALGFAIVAMLGACKPEPKDTPSDTVPPPTSTEGKPGLGPATVTPNNLAVRRSPVPGVVMLAATDIIPSLTVAYGWRVVPNVGIDSVVTQARAGSGSFRQHRYPVSVTTDTFQFARPDAGNTTGGDYCVASKRRQLISSFVCRQWTYTEPDQPPPPPVIDSSSTVGMVTAFERWHGTDNYDSISVAVGDWVSRVAFADSSGKPLCRAYITMGVYGQGRDTIAAHGAWGVDGVSDGLYLKRADYLSNPQCKATADSFGARVGLAFGTDATRKAQVETLP